MIAVPAAFAERTVARSGEAGRAWIESLPGRVGELCNLWNLEVESPAMHGEWGLVFAVRGTDSPAVLKVTWPDEDGSFHRAVTALSLWNGRGRCVCCGRIWSVTRCCSNAWTARRRWGALGSKKLCVWPGVCSGASPSRHPQTFPH